MAQRRLQNRVVAASTAQASAAAARAAASMATDEYGGGKSHQQVHMRGAGDGFSRKAELLKPPTSIATSNDSGYGNETPHSPSGGTRRWVEPPITPLIDPFKCRPSDLATTLTHRKTAAMTVAESVGRQNPWAIVAAAAAAAAATTSATCTASDQQLPSTGYTSFDATAWQRATHTNAPSEETSVPGTGVAATLYAGQREERMWAHSLAFTTSRLDLHTRSHSSSGVVDAIAATSPSPPSTDNLIGSNPASDPCQGQQQTSDGLGGTFASTRLRWSAALLEHRAFMEARDAAGTHAAASAAAGGLGPDELGLSGTTTVGDRAPLYSSFSRDGIFHGDARDAALAAAASQLGRSRGGGGEGGREGSAGPTLTSDTTNGTSLELTTISSGTRRRTGAIPQLAWRPPSHRSGECGEGGCVGAAAPSPHLTRKEGADAYGDVRESSVRDVPRPAAALLAAVGGGVLVDSLRPLHAATGGAPSGLAGLAGALRERGRQLRRGTPRGGELSVPTRAASLSSCFMR